MRSSGKGSGGGLGMNKNVSTRVETGKPREGIRPGYASQLGAAQGDRAMNGGSTGYRGEPMKATGQPMSVPLGNQVAGNVGAGGPGTGRTVHTTGSQGRHGRDGG